VHLGVENIHKVGAIGLPGYNWEAVKQGEVGELAVKGPGVMKCYYKDPEATAAVLLSGGPQERRNYQRRRKYISCAD